MAESRGGRRALIAAAVVLIVLVALVVLLPTLLSAGIAGGIVANAVEQRIDGSAKVQSASLSWFGPQHVSGLTIVAPAGNEVANLNATLDATLLAVVLGTIAPIDLDVSGTVRGTIDEDGHLSLRDLVKIDDAEKDTSDDGADESLVLDGVPATTIRFSGVELTLVMERPGSEDVSPNRSPVTLVVEELTGSATYEPGGTSLIELSGPTKAEDINGRIAIDLTAEQIFSSVGALTPNGATVRGKIEMENVPVAFVDELERIESLTIKPQASDLGESLSVNIALDARLSGTMREKRADQADRLLEGAVTLHQPVRSNGSLNVGLATISGTLTGRNLPAALAQPLLEPGPIALGRDVGLIRSATAEFSRGEEKQTTITIDAERLSGELNAAVAAGGAIAGASGEMTAIVQPGLIDDLMKNAEGERLWRASLVDQTTVRLVLDSFTAPAAASPNGRRPVGDVSFAANVTIGGDQPAMFEVQRPSDETTEGKSIRTTFGTSNLRIASERLANALTITGDVRTLDGAVRIDESISGLLDDSGALALASAEPIGTITLSGLGVADLAGLLVEAIPAAVVRELRQEPLNGTIATSRQADALAASVDLDGGWFALTSSMTRRPDALRIESATVRASVSPDLAAAIRKRDPEEPATVALDEASDVRIELDPLGLPGRVWTEYRLPDEEITARLTATETRLTSARLATPVVLRDIASAIRLTAGANRSIALDGEAIIEQPDEGHRIADASFSGSMQRQPGGWQTAATIQLDDARVRRVESILGRPRDALASWVGDRGSMRASYDPTQPTWPIAVEADLPNLTGRAKIAVDDRRIAARSDGVRLTITRPKLEALLSTSADDGRGRQPIDGGVGVAEALPLQLTLKNFEVPREVMNGESMEDTSASIDIAIIGGPLTIADDDGVLTRAEDLELTLESSDLAEGVRFALSGATTARNETKPGVIDMTGRVTRLFDEEQRFAPGRATVTAMADVSGVPTMLADALLDANGLLIAAAGPAMRAELAANAFARDTGSFGGRLEAAHGFVEGRVRGAEHVLQVSEREPINAELELTPEFRRRLLRNLHPLLADVRTTKKPIRLTVPGGSRFPHTGGLERLNARIELTIGEVEFNSGSTTLALLRLFDTPKPTVPGSIEPIRATIDAGVVTYERFTVQVGKYTMPFEGTVDLKTSQVNMNTQLPLEGLAKTFEELRGYEDKIDVPLVLRGPIGSAKLEIAPSFNPVQAILDAGLKIIDDELDGRDAPIGNILDEIFRRAQEQRKRKEEEEKDE